MANIPIKYRKSPEIIASFSFEDIASGLGVITFFGIASQDDSAVDYHLITNQTVYSQPTGTRRTSQGTTTIDFDSSAFNLQRVAKGTAFFSAGMAATNGQNVRLLVQLKLVSNSDVTNITSEITSQNHGAGLPPDTSEMVFLELPITETIIKQGDFLRLTVKLNQINASGNTDLGHDPKNQTFNDIVPGTVDTTVMTLLMPFKIPV